LIAWNFSEQYQFSINISPWQLDIINKDFWDEFLTTIERHHLSKNIILEITESCLSISTKYTTLLFERIQQLGIEVAVDDFGTGYSSMSYLKQFNVDYLKIDRAFIMNIDTDNSNQILTSAMTAMAHKLNIKVVAEGVETKEESRFLQQLNCDYQQGYLHYKPMPAEELHTLLCQQDLSNPTEHKT
jgi:EAL domain-containing protein (putative c-di-GMP-specific phosphodiesterase class I)